jgi:hypothetical protein
MEEASNGVYNCVSVDCGHRKMKSYLLANMKRHGQDANIVVAISVPLTRRINLCGLNGEERKPSDILKDQTKVDLLVSIFDPNGNLNTLTYPKVLGDPLKKANLLFILFEACTF